MEQRAADPQQPVLVELGGAGGPAELVVAVAPEVADHERRQAQVGNDHPEEDVHQRAPRERRHRQRRGSVRQGGPGSKAGVAYGVRPTSSSGGPSAASRRTASRSSPWSGGSVAVTASTAPAQREPAFGERDPQQLQPGAVVEHQPAAALVVDGGGVLQDDAQVVGQLAVGQLEAGRQVGLLEAEQRHAALAGVTVREVGQEQVVPTPVVEGVDVVGLQLAQRHPASRATHSRRGPPTRSGSPRAAAWISSSRPRCSSSGYPSSSEAACQATVSRAPSSSVGRRAEDHPAHR